MQIILLSGGSGTRLWPLSNNTRSKQFLKLLKDQNGEYQSMLQRMYSQTRESGIDAHITIATGESQVEPIRSQLKDAVDIVVEPERRNTFPAIALSCAYLALEKRLSYDEPVLVVPVDPFTDLDYFITLGKMADMVSKGISKLILMGIEPTYPSAKYGYIIPDSKEILSGVNPVLQFTEKPGEEEAKELIQKNAMWNGGVFGFRLGYMMDILSGYLKADTFEAVRANYGCLPKISFDYEVSEKEPSISVVRFHGQWKDLGTWNTLTEEIEDGMIGMGVMADTCENTHVINELEIPIVAMGLKDVVIAASPDGILISDKHQSSYIKPIVEPLIERPKYEERHWGEYRVLEYSTYSDGNRSLTKHIYMKKGEHLSYQAHKNRKEIWTIVNGNGLLILDGEKKNVSRADVVCIPQGCRHTVKAESDLHIMEVQIGNYLEEDDITRFDWEWNEE